MSDEVISASPLFRLKILALLLFSDWVRHYGIIVLPEYFQSADEKEVVSWLNDYVDEYGAVPSDADIQHALNDNPLLDEIGDISDSDIQYASDVAIEFAKTQAMKLAILQSVADVKSGDLAKVRDRVEGALRVGIDYRDIGWDLVDDASIWLYDEAHGKRYPTGIPSIDSRLGGGMVGGEYGLIMAPPGKGKTTALINIGSAMAGIMCAANVTHITLEMKKEKVLRRYARRIAHTSMVRGIDAKYTAKLKRDLKKNLRAHLRVADPPGTMDSIRMLLDTLDDAGHPTDALIVDYADLIVPPRRRKELRFELADISRDLRDIAVTRNIPVWSATQAGRQAFYKEVITLADISEAIEKAAIADVVLALCQTREEEAMGHGRIFGAKVRDAEGGFMVPVKIDFALQAITQRGKLSGSIR